MKSLEGKKEKSMSFEKELVRKGIAPNMFAAAAIFTYATVFTGIGLQQIPKAFLIVLIIIAPAQLIFSPITNRILLGNLKERIGWWKKNGFETQRERTDLLQDIMKFPVKKGAQTFFYFFICATFMAIGYALFLHINKQNGVLSYCACIFGSYNAAIMSFSFSSELCSDIAKKLVSEGIDENRVLRKKHLGISLKAQSFFYLFLPVIFASLLLILIMRAAYIAQETGSLTNNTFMIRIIITAACNVAICLVLAKQYLKKVTTVANSMHQTLEKLTSTNNTFEEKDLVPIDFANELSMDMYLINKTVTIFQTLITHAEEIGNQVYNATNELSITAKETASTSLEQSAGVKEVVATMEDADSLSKNISSKMNLVSNLALQTRTNVEEGFSVLQHNLEKMTEITTANITTIEGIKSLNAEITGIWDIVNIINEIADQTKIIAFNAELEASNAGNEGKNFHIVANEIRRLANGTMDSVNEIRNKITDIQHASTSLIVTSQSETSKIEEGYALTNVLEDKFNTIKYSSDSTTDSASEIQDIIEQQTSAFDQIVITLKQISTASDNFSGATKTISTAVEELRSLSESMHNLLSQNQ